MDDFRPLPLLGNPHLQTVLGTWGDGPALSQPTVEHRVTLPDGDVLVLHDTAPPSWRPGDPIALLAHGLCGSHASGNMKRLARFLLPGGVRVVRIDQRGWGRGTALARRTYHGGASEDLRAAAAAVHAWSPTSPLALVGVSLGGNVVLKLAGEASTVPVPGLVCVAAIAPPVDFARAVALLGRPTNRFYDRHFVSELVAHIERRQRLLPDLPRIRFPRRLTLREFDELFTAPQWGFPNALDYYQRGSSFPVVPHIAVPTLILSARDDPFIPPEPFEELRVPEHIQIHLVERGGHVGFLGWDGRGGFRWAERRVTDWVRQQLWARATLQWTVDRGP